MKNLDNTLITANDLYKRGDFGAAWKRLEPLLQRRNSPKAAHLASMIARDSGDYKAALSYLETSLSLHASDYEALNTLGTIWVKLQDPIRAELAFKAALKQSPDYVTALINLAFCHLDFQNPKAALPLLQRLIILKPDNPTYEIAHVHALKDTQKNREALNALKAIEQTSECKEERAFLKGQILFQAGEYERAIESNKEALSSPVYGPKAIANTAQILIMLGQWSKASVLLDAILKDEPHRPEMSLAIARVFYNKGDSKTAEDVLKTSLSKMEHADSLSFQARVKVDKDQIQIAYEKAFEALKMRPGDLGLMAEFARAAMVSGHVDEAMHAAQQALSMEPNNQFWMAMRATGGRLLGTDYHYYFDYKKYVRSYDIDIPTGFETIEAFNAQLALTLESLHVFSKAPLDQSVRVGTQTSPNLVHLDTPILTQFFDAVQRPLKDYMASIGMDNGHPLTRRNTGKARICTAWSVKLDKAGHHLDHIHPEGWISSAYYVQVPPIVESDNNKSGWIRFGQPPFNVNLGAEHFIKPKAGRLVLFPSYMWHGTVPLTKDGVRLTLPFDVLPDIP